jgi:hypothetical protein
MSAIEAEAAEYIVWLQVHNYAETTVACRVRYLAYFVRFCQCQGIEDPRKVTFELLQGYQRQLFEHRKRCGDRSPPRRRRSDSCRSRTSSPGCAGQGEWRSTRRAIC